LSAAVEPESDPYPFALRIAQRIRLWDIAMRFPRISRIRWEKPTREPDRLETLTAILD
jgi:ATP-dependent DNA ligase